MTEIITKDCLDTFQDVTLYNISVFLQKYIDFTDTDYPDITNYFSGASNVSPTDALSNLQWLQKEYKKIIDVVILNAPSLNDYEFWCLVEYIEDIGSALETAANASKWLRSASTSNGFKKQVIANLTLSQNQTLEDLELNDLKSNDPDAWVETALQNNLREEDYDLNGGTLIKVIYKNNTSLFINGVVDNIDTPQKTYGLDIDQKIAIINSDLSVLGYYDTMVQSATILGNLKKGDDPAFPDRGYNIKGLIGGNQNLAGLAYPVIFKDLAANFATDDTFQSFSINDVKKNGTAAYIEYSISTKAGEVLNDLQLEI